MRAASPDGGLVVGLDASRNRSGGAKAHLIGLLSAADPRDHGIREVHVWSYASLLAALPERDWLVKHGDPALEGSLFQQAWWQYRHLPTHVRRAGCRVLLNTDAGTVGRFEPSVVMSRDMLSYEPGAMRRYGWTLARLRLILLRHIQARSLRRAAGALFLTRYAATVIQQVTGPLPRVAVVPHGVGENFRRPPKAEFPANGAPIRCLYVSNAAMYKHQWVVVEALASLRARGWPVRLTLAGGGWGRAQELLDAQIRASDPKREFVESLGAVPHARLPEVLSQADLFIFASSCENMPNTLLEAMASGLPVACSDRGPMPEVLQDGGVYFDPEDAKSIASAVARIVEDPELRRRIAARASELSEAFSWQRCARETWSFLRECAREGGTRTL